MLAGFPDLSATHEKLKVRIASAQRLGRNNGTRLSFRCAGNIFATGYKNVTKGSEDVLVSKILPGPVHAALQ
jgi:hypothetical protein